MQAVKNVLYDAVDTDFDELVALCTRLIEIPSANPPGDTREVAEFVTDYLSSLGYPVEQYAPHPERPNVITAVGDGAGPHLVINSHLDTFPAARGDWHHPPFKGVVADGKLFGCGVSDMRAGLAVALWLARMLKELAIRIPGRITFMFASDEESGSKYGAEWLFANVAHVRGDACLVGDQMGTWAIGNGEKGPCWLKVQTTGSSSHGAYGQTRSATVKLLDVLNTLLPLAGLEAQLEPATVEAVAKAKAATAQALGEDASALLDKLTVNVGVLAGGQAVNLVADKAEAHVDFRLPVGMSSANLLERINTILQANGLADCHITPISMTDPTWTDPTSRIVRIAKQVTAEVRGEAAAPTVRVGASDARFSRLSGIPTIVYGPRPHNMGAPNEFITLDDLRTVAKVHAGIALEFCLNTPTE